MISKETFIKCIEFIKRKREQQEKLSNALQELDNFNDPTCVFNEYEDMLISLLNEAMKLPCDEFFGTDLDYFIYELDFGREIGKLDEDCALYGIDSSDKLYDYLIKENGNE